LGFGIGISLIMLAKGYVLSRVTELLEELLDVGGLGEKPGLQLIRDASVDEVARLGTAKRGAICSVLLIENDQAGMEAKPDKE
jgi:hypothetical protein